MLFHKNAKRFNQIDSLLSGIKRTIFTLYGLDVEQPGVLNANHNIKQN